MTPFFSTTPTAFQPQKYTGKTANLRRKTLFPRMKQDKNRMRKFTVVVSSRPRNMVPRFNFTKASFCHLALASRSSCLFDLKQQTWGDWSIDPPKIHYELSSQDLGLKQENDGPTGIRFTKKSAVLAGSKKHSWLMIIVNHGGYYPFLIGDDHNQTPMTETLRSSRSMSRTLLGPI